MKAEMMLQTLAKKTPDYLWTSGSHLYGTSTPSSDIDLRGFLFPPFEYLIGVKKFESIEFDEDDHKIYSAAYFIKLALKGDPLVTEGLFASSNMVSHLTDIGRTILDMKEDMLSMAIFGRVLGFSASEWRKCMAVKLISKERSREKKEIINDIRNMWSPDKETMDEICSILDGFDEKVLVPSDAGLGVKRKQDIEEYGYCRKSAMHSIRLVSQLIEIMDTGTMTFPRPNASLLQDIRNGKYSKEELQDMYDTLVHEAESKKEKSVLPPRPNEKRVWQKYTEIAAFVLGIKMS